MNVKGYRNITAIGGLALVLAITGCKQLPGSPGAQGATIGGVSGAAVGAAVGGSQHRLLGALIGGAVGAGGGYLIGANSDKIVNRDKSGANEAVRRAQATPATPEQVRTAATADINNDGFVTMDEVVAMQKAGLSDQEMIRRLNSTGQVFELTPAQQDYLRQQGVSSNVITAMNDLNRTTRDHVMGQSASGDVLSRPADAPRR